MRDHPRWAVKVDAGGQGRLELGVVKVPQLPLIRARGLCATAQGTEWITERTDTLVFDVWTIDHRLFFGPDREGPETDEERAAREAAAVDVCGHCDVREECALWATAARESGVWGGLTEKQRKGRQRNRGVCDARNVMKETGELPMARQGAGGGTWR